jgi:hypothetical protein
MLSSRLIHPGSMFFRMLVGCLLAIIVVLRTIIIILFHRHISTNHDLEMTNYSPHRKSVESDRLTIDDSLLDVFGGDELEENEVADIFLPDSFSVKRRSAFLHANPAEVEEDLDADLASDMRFLDQERKDSIWDYSWPKSSTRGAGRDRSLTASNQSPEYLNSVLSLAYGEEIDHNPQQHLKKSPSTLLIHKSSIYDTLTSVFGEGNINKIIRENHSGSTSGNNFGP